ncbi:MAG: NADH:flavin oxidoreductase [Proteobacteria bacterium]|jgi:dimethylglycine catabolism A|nr:NADH:flavin oxidoreductase [Pseudomonadota bacterium]
MWKPPEKIKHLPNPGKWPDREEVQKALLYQPINIGHKVLNERSWIPAMVPWRSTDEGIVTDEVIEWYRRFAQGKPGAIVVEATGIRDIPSGPLLRIGHDRYIEGLTKLVDAVRVASEGKTKLFIQIIDFLAMNRRPDPSKYFARYLKITNEHKTALGAEHWQEDKIRDHLSTLNDEDLEKVLNERELESLRLGHRDRVTDVELDRIKELPQTLPILFSDAAERAKKAGFDGVELHYAHAYTMASFLSARNTRPDGYGGRKENRIRLPLEVFEAVRKRVGDDYLVGCRFLSEDCIDGGSNLEDACYFGKQFARAGMDFISLSRGGKFEDALQPKIGGAVYPYTGPSGYECMPQFMSDEKGPYGRNVEPANEIRKVIREAGYDTPVVVAGGIHSFEQAEGILQAGKADIIGMARQTLADPDWFRKVRKGKGEEIRVCKYTNYCEGLDQKHKVVTCQLWDRIGLDSDNVPKTPDGKRRLTAPEWKNEI